MGLQLNKTYTNKLTGETCIIKTCAYLGEDEQELLVIYKKENRSSYAKELNEFLKEFEII